MEDFWKAPYPFNDFAAVTFKIRPSELTIQRILSESGRVGIDNITRHSAGKYKTLLFSALAPKKTRVNTTILSGVAQLNGRLIYGQNHITDDFARNPGESIGIFTCISIGRKEIVVSQDYTGSGVLYYCDTQDFFVVSNRYHLLLLFLKSLGYKGELDYSKVISSFYSKTTFLDQNISSKMDISGTYQLPLHKEIRINRRGVHIIDKRSVLHAFIGTSSIEKKELMELGAKEIVDNVRSVIESGIFTKKVIDLSGGLDSRAVLAALLNIDGGINEVEIFTKNVPQSDDLKIATGLKNLYGGRFYKEEGRPQYPLTLNESEKIWRSYFMGTYYTMGLGAWSPRGENFKQIRLSGGCGEIYRGFWYSIYRKGISEPKNVYDLAEQLVNMFQRISTENDDEKEILKHLIADELSSIPGRTPIEKLENHYIFFRNRYHFGMRAFEYYNDCSMWFPLLSKSAFKAALASTIEERQSKRLMIELTSILHPLLVWIEYDGFSLKDIPELHDIHNLDVRLKGINLKLDYSHEDWMELEDQNRKELLKHRPRMDTSFYEEWRNSKEIITQKALAYFEELRAYYPNIFNDRLYENIRSYANNNNTRALHGMYARLCSIKDQIDIFESQ